MSRIIVDDEKGDTYIRQSVLSPEQGRGLEENTNTEKPTLNLNNAIILTGGFGRL